ncbi:ATP-binding cassette domain-containing protein [Tissierella sp. Yu-01]|uniref:amino acid ABC transporter ATP-binding protein n=1 Tax=Tissierella sp. Yu-01 TaxID=3035694 RepID=UPI00240DEC65|nr:ATP-binding cassette domain-containing protein [Tissierella sp. Yu-01]WFA08058.1 ATP-binding cassette domain-containing protein [Tissierella sp. Yu-01]
MTLTVYNLSKSFGDTLVFKDISFTIGKGEIVCIKGKSGQGKTTLLRCLNNLETPDKGSIKINNNYLCKEIDGKMKYASKDVLKEIRQDIGLVFQSFNLFSHMTVKENLLLAPEFLNKISKSDIEKRAIQLLSRLELSNKADNYPYELSGGQKQRVAIARACMLEPSILCFDEPTSALDEDTRGQISKIVRDLALQDIAIIIVTHDNAFVDEIAEKVITLTDGGIYIE